MEFECVALLVGTFVVVYSRRLPVPGYQVLYQVPGTGSSFLVYNTTMVDMIAKLNNKIIGRSSREQQKEKNVKREEEKKKRRKNEKKLEEERGRGREQLVIKFLEDYMIGNIFYHTSNTLLRNPYRLGRGGAGTINSYRCMFWFNFVLFSFSFLARKTFPPL